MRPPLRWLRASALRIGSPAMSCSPSAAADRMSLRADVMSKEISISIRRAHGEKTPAQQLAFVRTRPEPALEDRAGIIQSSRIDRARHENLQHACRQRLVGEYREHAMQSWPFQSREPRRTVGALAGKYHHVAVELGVGPARVGAQAHPAGTVVFEQGAVMQSAARYPQHETRADRETGNAQLLLLVRI